MLTDSQHSLGRHRSASEINDKLLFMDYTKSYKTPVTHFVDPDIAYKYQGNFYGLLIYMDIHPGLFTFTLQLNGLTSPHQYKGEGGYVTVPQEFPVPFSKTR